MQVNTWVSCDSSHQSQPVFRSQRLVEEHIYLEDVQTDEDKLNSSMLSSESTFLPFTSDLEAQTAHSDSEDETETFEPDSLAPNQPTQPKKHMHHSPTVDKHVRKSLDGEVTSGAGIGSLEVRVSTPQNVLEVASDFAKAEMKEATRQGEDSKSSLIEADRAAVKIQSWWRGRYIRCCHPMAREVRNEIRLRRMQEHIVFLSDKLDR